MDSTRITQAVNDLVESSVQAAVRQTVALMQPEDPIQAAIQNNLAAMSAANPGILSDPKARRAAEAMAILEVADQNGRDPSEMMVEFYSKRTQRPAQAAQPPKSTKAREVPGAARVPSSTVAPQSSVSRPRGAAVNAVLASLMGSDEDEVDIRDFRKRDGRSMSGRRR